MRKRKTRLLVGSRFPSGVSRGEPISPDRTVLASYLCPSGRRPGVPAADPGRRLLLGRVRSPRLSVSPRTPAPWRVRDFKPTCSTKTMYGIFLRKLAKGRGPCAPCPLCKPVAQGCPLAPRTILGAYNGTRGRAEVVKPAPWRNDLGPGPRRRGGILHRPGSCHHM